MRRLKIPMNTVAPQITHNSVAPRNTYKYRSPQNTYKYGAPRNAARMQVLALAGRHGLGVDPYSQLRHGILVMAC